LNSFSFSSIVSEKQKTILDFDWFEIDQPRDSVPGSEADFQQISLEAPEYQSKRTSSTLVLE
jgi:hypothetical protein